MKKSSILLLPVVAALLFLLLKFSATALFSQQANNIPYPVQKRPLPQGSDFSKILPKKVGSFERIAYHAPTPNEDGDAIYRSGKQEIFMLFSLSDKLEDTDEIMKTIYTEIKNEKTVTREVSFKTNPSYILFLGKKIAFFAWTRDKYCFSADSKNGDKADEVALNQFMNAFPY